MEEREFVLHAPSYVETMITANELDSLYNKSEKILDMMAAGLTEYWINQEGILKATINDDNEDPRVMTLKQLEAPFYM
ncbi:hypothetical protein PVAND_013500, partial [Polypedilum vanderplanki]